MAPPIVGRPVDFSGAVGGPFVVQWVADPTDLVAERPLILTLHITGPGNLADMPRPPLAKLDAFKPFAVEDLDDRFVPGAPPRREFRYRVRPRSADVKEIPRFRFVYFNPRIVPASRGYQTTYADAVPLTVKPRKPAVPDVPADVPDWMLDYSTSSEIYEWPHNQSEAWLVWLRSRLGIGPSRSWDYAPSAVILPCALLVVPAGCAAWLAIWRRRHPDAARLTHLRRSRAAAAALRSLRTADSDPARHIAKSVTCYLHSRLGLTGQVTTPIEVGQALCRQDSPAALTEETVAVLRQCDAARFAPPHGPDPALADRAERLILEWEGSPWSPAGA